jgi:hypothetical protein
VPATANAFAYERCIQLTTVSAAERHLRVTVTPTVPGVRPDTLVVRRADIAVPPPILMRAPRPLAARRRGASIIEILVVLGLAGLVAAALVRMLLSQTRIFERQSADQDARSIARAALGLLASDLRMVDGVGGIVAASAQSFTARVPYAMGILCRTDPAVVSLLPGVPALDPNPTGIAGREGPYGYAWRDSLSGTYQYVEVGAVTARPATVLEAAACTGAGVTTLTTPGARPTCARSPPRWSPPARRFPGWARRCSSTSASTTASSPPRPGRRHGAPPRRAAPHERRGERRARRPVRRPPPPSATTWVRRTPSPPRPPRRTSASCAASPSPSSAAASAWCPAPTRRRRRG